MSSVSGGRVEDAWRNYVRCDPAHSEIHAARPISPESFAVIRAVKFYHSRLFSSSFKRLSLGLVHRRDRVLGLRLRKEDMEDYRIPLFTAFVLSCRVIRHWEVYNHIHFAGS